jgi:uncharacterized protein (DUF952 family)
MKEQAMDIIIHIARREDWERAKRIGFYKGDTLETQGYIHCSLPRQIINVANSVYKGKRGLVLLCIDTRRIAAEVRYEGVEGGDKYPHIYGSLNVDSVVDVFDFEPNEEGLFKLPLKLEQLGTLDVVG